MRSTTRTLGAIAIAAGLFIPAAMVGGLPATAVADEPGPTCGVTGGDLTWGVKEAFRSYISGTIANGEWTTSGGASYETPSFTFSDAQGEIDATTGEGSISFSGTVNFTGHEGVLNLTLANPTIEFPGDGSARLLLDTKSNNAEGELVVDSEQVAAGKVGSIGEIDPSSGSLTVTDAATILTADGAEAFSGFYATGEELDPISLAVDLGPCAGEKADDSAASGEAEGVEPISAEDPGVPWLPIVIGGVALVVIAVATTLLIAGRKKQKPGSDADDASAESAAEDL